MKITKKYAMFLTAIVAIVAGLLLVYFLRTPMAHEDDFAMNSQTLDEIIERVNSDNINDLVQGVDFELASVISPCQPSEFVRQYIEMDPGYITYLEDYFAVTILLN